MDEQVEDDMVNHPPHYQLGNNIEVIDVIKGALTPEQYKGYLKGNAIKYLLRAGRKGSEFQDLLKGNMYLDWWITKVEDNSE